MQHFNRRPGVITRIGALLLFIAAMSLVGCITKSTGGGTSPTTTPAVAGTGASGATGTPFPDQIAPPVALTGNSCVDWPLVHERSVVAITGNSGQVRRLVPQFINDISK